MPGSETDAPTPLERLRGLTNSVVRRLLPMVSAIDPSIGVVLTAIESGLSVRDDVTARDIANRLATVERTVHVFVQRVSEVLNIPPDQVLDLLGRPDLRRLVAECRDVHDIAQFEPRLRRLADVIAGRAARESTDLRRDLMLARAAVELDDVTVAFIMAMPDLGHGAAGPWGKDPANGRCTTGVAPAEWIAQRDEIRESAANGLLLATGIIAAERLGLIYCAATPIGRAPKVVRFDDGGVAPLPCDAYDVTAWGRAFQTALRRHEESGT